MTPFDPPHPDYILYDDEGLPYAKPGTPDEFKKDIEEWVVNYLDSAEEDEFVVNLIN